MNTRKRKLIVLGALVFSGALLAGLGGVASAQVATGKPKEATGLCKDGTFHTGADQATACRANGGLQEWWGKVLPPKDVPETTPAKPAEEREAYDKALHPKPVSPPAGDKAR